MKKGLRQQHSDSTSHTHTSSQTFKSLLPIQPFSSDIIRTDYILGYSQNILLRWIRMDGWMRSAGEWRIRVFIVELPGVISLFSLSRQVFVFLHVLHPAGPRLASFVSSVSLKHEHGSAAVNEFMSLLSGTAFLFHNFPFSSFRCRAISNSQTTRLSYACRTFPRHFNPASLATLNSFNQAEKMKAKRKISCYSREENVLNNRREWLENFLGCSEHNGIGKLMLNNWTFKSRFFIDINIERARLRLERHNEKPLSTLPSLSTCSREFKGWNSLGYNLFKYRIPLFKIHSDKERRLMELRSREHACAP